MIYVATEDLEDAFRLFMILNDRGIPLRNSDILKSTNLGALDNEVDKIKYAKIWEQAEGELGDDFDRFLNHIRTILVKEKARLSLLKEFEDKIYKVDPSDGQVVSRFYSPDDIPSGLTWDGQYLWCADITKGKIYKLDVQQAPLFCLGTLAISIIIPVTLLAVLYGIGIVVVVILKKRGRLKSEKNN